ncbi:MAG: HU family DNA-binding protein [Methylotenera sp.]
MTKQELIDALHIARGSYFKKHQIASIVDALTDIVSAEIYRGNEVNLPGIGKIIPKQVDERIGRNPQNGEPVTIPAHVKVMFKVSKTLKDKVNQ